MTGKHFVELLSRPEKVYEMPLSQLEQLLKKHPYSKNVQLLYLKKLNSLGSTQNENEFKKYAMQHQHPMMFSQFISENNQEEEHEEINKLYQDIFDSIHLDKAENTESSERAETKLMENEEAVILDTHQSALHVEQEEEEKVFEEKYEIKEEMVVNKGDSTFVDETLLQGEYEVPESIDDEINNLSDNDHIRYILVKDDSSKKIKEEKKKKEKKDKHVKKKAKRLKVKKVKADQVNTKEIKTKEDKTIKEKAKKPAKKLTYVDWLDGLKSTAEVVKSEIVKGSKKKGKKKKKKKKGDKLQSKINKSLVRNTKIYTETLAQLLEKQGHKKEAIEIYRQLMHNNPEKSDYFAGRIDKLK